MLKIIFVGIYLNLFFVVHMHHPEESYGEREENKNLAKSLKYNMGEADRPNGKRQRSS